MAAAPGDVELKMQPALHGIPQAPFGEDGYKGDDNDAAGGQDHGRPGQLEGVPDKSVNEQFNPDA